MLTLKKAQASLEYLMIVGFVLVIILPLVYIFYTNLSGFSDDIAVSKIDKIGNAIVNSAEQMYYLGAPSKTTLTLDFPQGVVDMYTADMNTTLVIILKNQSLYFDSAVPITTYLSDNDISEGTKIYKVETLTGVVAIYTDNLADSINENYLDDVLRELILSAENLADPFFKISHPRYELVTYDPQDVAYLKIDLSDINTVNFDMTIRRIDSAENFLLMVGNELMDEDGISADDYINALKMGALFDGQRNLRGIRKADSGLEFYGECFDIILQPDSSVHDPALLDDDIGDDYNFTVYVSKAFGEDYLVADRVIRESTSDNYANKLRVRYD